MTGQSKPYARYGSFILFRKLEESSLAEIWRAGRIESNTIVETVTLLRFTGGDIASLKRAAERAAPALPALRGSTVVKGQTYHLVGKNPIITWEHSGGRSLQNVMQAARGGPDAPANPIPIDQALAIAEKLAMSLDATGQTKQGGRHLHHGALIPPFVWISEDGDVRTLGHQLGPGLVSSMKRPSVQAELGGYVAPEIRRSGEATGASEVWPVGAMLYAMLSDRVLPPPTDQPAIDALLDEAVLSIDEPLPPQVLEILRKSLAIDPARRYESPGALREELGRLTRGGDYAPTTFNLAFYIHNLLGEELDQDAAEREAESGVDPALVPPLGGVARAEPEEPSGDESGTPSLEPVLPPPPPAGSRASEKRAPVNRTPLLVAAAVLLLLALSAAGYWFTAGPGSGRAQRTADGPALADPEVRTGPQPPVPAPVIAATDTGEGGMEIAEDTTGELRLGDDQTRQQMIQDEIERRLQEEIMKLQADYDRKLREERAREQARTQPARQTAQTPAATPSTPAATEQRPTPPPTERPATEPAARESTIATTDTAVAASPPPARSPAAGETIAAPAPPPPPPPAVPQVREGDLIEFSEVDQPPTFQRRVEPDYPPLAARQRAEATIFLSVLISETGSVLDVRVLRGDQRRMGFEDAAEAAIRKSTFHPAIKDGKRVRTWMPVPIIFKAR
jgi:periplasmic protein TonB